MATGTQMVLGVKKIIKIIVPSGLHEDKKLDRSLKLRSFCIHIFILKILILYNYVGCYKLDH